MKRPALVFAIAIIALTLIFLSRTPSKADTWAVGNKVGLPKGTLIRVGSSLSYPVEACAPTDNWLVLVIGGPRTANGLTWWDTSRKALDQLPTSGTGWVAPNAPVGVCPNNGTLTPVPGGGDTQPPVITNVKPWSDGKGDVIISATITDDTAVSYGALVTDNAEYAMTAGSGSKYYAIVKNLKCGSTLHYNINALDPAGNLGTWPAQGTSAMKIYCTSQVGQQSWSTMVQEPISLPLGNFFSQHTDLTVPSIGIPFTFTRSYNAQAPFDGPLGYGWTDSYNFHLEEIDNPLFTGAFLTYPDGHTAEFAANGNDFTAPPGYADTLTRNGSGFAITTPDRIHYIFDAQGHLTRESDRNNNTLVLTYTGDNLTSITDTAGRNYTLSYNGIHLTSLTDPIGRVFHYTYGSAGTLDSVQLPANRNLTYTYDSAYRLTSITDPNSHTFVTNVFDNRDRVIQQGDASSSTATLKYADDDSQVVVTDYAGKPTTYHFNTDFLLTQETDALGYSLVYDYDANHNRTSVKDRNGNLTLYQYDQWNNVSGITDPIQGSTTLTYQNGHDLVDMINARGDEITATYDGNGNRQTFTTGLGTITYKYDSHGLPTEIDDAVGNVTMMSYDGQGNPTSVVDALKHPTLFQYDGVSRLTSVTDANNHTSTFVYDDADRLTSITDPLKKVTALSYDGVGNLLTIQDRLGAITTFTYTVNDQIETVIDPLKFTTTMTYDKTYHQTSIMDRRGGITKFGYDNVYNLVGVTDPAGGLTAYAYDPNRQVVKVTNPLGNSTLVARDVLNRITRITDALQQHTDLTYDQIGDIVSVHDPRGGTTQYTYNALQQVTTILNAIGGITRYVYDANGNTTQVIDPLHQPTAYLYDGLNRVIQITDAQHQQEHFEYDPVGNLLKITDKKGQITSTTYNANDLPIAVLDANGGTTGYDRDAEGHITTITNQNNHPTTLTYDARGEPISITLPEGQSASFTYDGNGNRVSMTDAKKGTWKYAFDPRDLLVQTLDPLTNSTSYGYDVGSRLTTITDGNGKVTKYGYNALDYLTSVIQNFVAGTPINDPKVSDRNVQTTYGRDPLGALLSITDPKGNIQQFKVDVLGRTTQEQNAAGKTWQYSYDADSNLVKRIDANAATTNYTYDVLNRLTQIGYSSGQQTSYAYDPNDNLVNMTDQSGQTGFGYDALNELTSISRLSGSLSGQKIQRTIDPAGNLTSVQYPDGRTMTYGYNKNEWLTSAIDPNAGHYTYSYDPNGLLQQLSFPNGTTTTRQYDAANRLTGLSNTGPGGVFSAFTYTLDKVGNRLQEGETYLETGNPPINNPGQGNSNKGATSTPIAVGSPTMTPISSAGGSSGRPTGTRTINYGYDGLYQVLTAQYSTGEFFTYTHDLAGNVLSEQTNWNLKTNGNKPASVTRQFTYNAANQLTSLDTTQFQYDNNGNRIKSTSPSEIINYTYNIENELTGYQSSSVKPGGNVVPDVTLDFTYDGLLRQTERGTVDKGVRKTTGSLYSDFGFSAAVESDTPGQTSNFYLDPLGQRLSMQEIQGAGSGLQHFFQTDGVGSTSVVSNQAGQQAFTYEYSPYGMLNDGNGADNASNHTDPINHYAFDGTLWDQESNLYNFGTRLYDPSTLNWLTQDRYRGNTTHPSSLNRYAFVDNNPVNFADKDGYFGLDTVTNFLSQIYNSLKNPFSGFFSPHSPTLQNSNNNSPAFVPVAHPPVAEVGTTNHSVSLVPQIPFNERATAQEKNCAQYALDYAQRSDLPALPTAADYATDSRIKNRFQLNSNDDLISKLQRRDIVIWPRGVAGASSTAGHAAVITEVRSDSITIHENFWCKGSDRRWDKNTQQCQQLVRGVWQTPIVLPGGQDDTIAGTDLKNWHLYFLGVEKKSSN